MRHLVNNIMSISMIHSSADCITHFPVIIWGNFQQSTGCGNHQRLTDTSLVSAKTQTAWMHRCTGNPNVQGKQ